MLTYDIHIELLPPERQSVRRGVLGYGFVKTISVAGLQRLTNRFLLELLTEVGTDPTDKARGTIFPRLIGSNVQSERDIQDVVELSLSQTVSRLRKYESRVPKSFTADDRISSATLESIQFADQSTSVSVVVRLESQAGRLQRIAIPL